MEISFSEISKTTAFFPSGESVHLKNLYIDSNTGKVLFFSTFLGFLSAEDILIHEKDWTVTGKITHEHTGENWSHFKVQNRKGRNRGKISEIWIHSKTFFVTKIECTKTFFGFLAQKRIFSTEDIFQVLPHKHLIIVEEENRIFQKGRSAFKKLNPIPAIQPVQSLR